jgi:hypothetical protein
MERSVTCPACGHETKTGVHDFEKHITINHPDLQCDFQAQRTFQNLLLIPGLGHFEINMVKGLFKLAWHVLLSDMAKLMGFRTDRTLAYCQKASNHHKAWQMVLILLFGTADELLLPYVRVHR